MLASAKKTGEELANYRFSSICWRGEVSGKQLKLDKVLLAVEKGAPPSYAPACCNKVMMKPNNPGTKTSIS